MGYHLASKLKLLPDKIEYKAVRKVEQWSGQQAEHFCVAPRVKVTYHHPSDSTSDLTFFLDMYVCQRADKCSESLVLGLPLLRQYRCLHYFTINCSYLYFPRLKGEPEPCRVLQYHLRGQPGSPQHTPIQQHPPIRLLIDTTSPEVYLPRGQKGDFKLYTGHTDPLTLKADTHPRLPSEYATVILGLPFLHQSRAVIDYFNGIIYFRPEETKTRITATKLSYISCPW
ncbi:hypothetical protein Pcinc_038170 [Petrolisthes cinctipes]|uniref:Uncharacterized protein n=1 Tax=Petrolisthes cinctipes TaxID=88211 RepID=A0AAE1BR25_PETCI|nr:hypothetical protein Pcinc_040061 [Petrolisthes cinctipes]KAK3855421.1 hypothetical protein Pcinc_038170 [Petrolisthes cinctipes]